MATINNYNQLEYFNSIRLEPVFEMKKLGGFNEIIDPNTKILTNSQIVSGGSRGYKYDPSTGYGFDFSPNTPIQPWKKDANGINQPISISQVPSNIITKLNMNDKNSNLNPVEQAIPIKIGAPVINVDPITGVITTNNGSIKGNPSNIYDPVSRFGYDSIFSNKSYYKNNIKGIPEEIDLIQIPDDIQIKLGLVEKNENIRMGVGRTSYQYDPKLELVIGSNNSICGGSTTKFDPLSGFGYTTYGMCGNKPPFPTIYFNHNNDKRQVILDDIPVYVKVLLGLQKPTECYDLPPIRTYCKLDKACIEASESKVVEKRRVCPPKIVDESKDGLVEKSNNYSIYIIVACIIVILILGGLLYFRKKQETI